MKRSETINKKPTSHPTLYYSATPARLVGQGSYYNMIHKMVCRSIRPKRILQANAARGGFCAHPTYPFFTPCPIIRQGSYYNIIHWFRIANAATRLLRPSHIIFSSHSARLVGQGSYYNMIHWFRIANAATRRLLRPSHISFLHTLPDLSDRGRTII